MAFNGSGTFVRLKSWVTNAALGINILPDLMDQDTNDIASGLSACVTRDGQGVPTNNISWAGYLINNLGTPLASTDGANKGYVDIATSARSMSGFVLNNVGAPVVSTDAANMAYVQSFAYSVAFPSQPGNGGLGLNTNGTAVSWGISAADGLAIINYLNS